MHRIQLVRAPAGARTLRVSSGGCAAQGERRGAAPHPGRNLRRCSIVALSLRSAARFASRLRLAVSSAGRAHLRRPAPPTLGFAFLIHIHASGLARPRACGRANIARFFGRLRRTRRTAGRCPAPRQEPEVPAPPTLGFNLCLALTFGVLHLPLLALTFAPRSPSPSRFSHYFFHSPHFYPQNCLFHSPERGILYTS